MINDNTAPNLPSVDEQSRIDAADTAIAFILDKYKVEFRSDEDCELWLSALPDPVRIPLEK